MTDSAIVPSSPTPPAPLATVRADMHPARVYLAGLGERPELRSLRTPVPGTPLSTQVQVCLPATAEPADPP